MKTILFIDHTSKLGGGELALLHLVMALDHDRYYPVVVLASEGSLVQRLRAAGIETHVFPLSPIVVDARKDSLRLVSLLTARRVAHCVMHAVRLAQFARRLGADLIHTNSLKADVYGGLAGRLAGIPVVWHVRDQIDGRYLPPTVAALFRRLVPVIPSVVVANSESTLRSLHLQPDKPTCVVYSGVASLPAKECPPGDGESHETGGSQMCVAREAIKTRPPSDDPIVALVGRIAPWKGQHVFLRAAAQVRERFPAARFWIVGAPLFGEDDYERSLHTLAEELGVAGQVTFWGFREDVPALLAQTDLLVHASTLGEPFGQVVIEGMAAGKPVIATDGGALPEIVLPGETGLLVPMGDAAGMAAAIAALLADPARAAAMGAAGRQRVQEQFTITHTAHRVQAIYDHLLAGTWRGGCAPGGPWARGPQFHPH